MITKVSFSSGGYYENEYYLVRHLEKNISKLFLIYSLINSSKLPAKRTSISTRILNNFETADAQHYLVFTRNNRKLIPTCIPIHDRLSRSLELSNLNMDIPISLDEQLVNDYDRMSSFVDMVYRQSLGTPHRSCRNSWMFFDRIRRSLSEFVRSYQTKYLDDAILFLSIAFEIVYSDKIKQNVSQKLATNLACLFPKNISHEIYECISELYDSRSGVAHEGIARAANIDRAREIYFQAFMKVGQLITEEKLDVNSERPFSSYAERYLKEMVGFSPV
jgi:hypothetical protein